MSNILVAYFSRKGENHMPGGLQILEKGHTARAAETIAASLGADLFEIETVTPYAAGYRDCCAQAVAVMKASARPEIRGGVADMAQYDTVFVGFPCWCGTAPMCVFTFLEQYDFSGKKVIPLCTNEGSGMANAVADFRRSCPTADVTEGLAILGHTVESSAEVLENWAKSQL